MTTAAGFAALRLVRHAEEQGLPPDEVATWLGRRRDELEARPRIPIDHLYRAWASLAKALGDPAVGTRAAAGLTVADLDLFGFCVATAPTGGAAAGTAVRYAPLITDSGRWDIEEQRGDVILTWTRTGPLTLGRAISNEAAIASFAVCFRELTGASPQFIELRHRLSSRPGDQRDLLRCPVRFGRDQDRIHFDKSAFQVVPRQANTGLWKFLSALADKEIEIARRGRGYGARSRVERALEEVLDRAPEHLPAAETIARSLGMSERTLRRRLAQEATTYRAVLDQARRNRAEELVNATTATLTEVALSTGFADVSGFGHAWRRWFGIPASKSRREPEIGGASNRGTGKGRSFRTE